MKYTVVIEKGENTYGAYVPDLPGCVAAGETREEFVALIQEAIEFHIEGPREDGLPIRTLDHAARLATPTVVSCSNAAYVNRYVST